MKRKWCASYLVLFLLAILLFNGCGNSIPSASFGTDEAVNQKAQQSVREHVKDNSNVAAESTTQAEKDLKEATGKAYDKLWETADSAQSLGIKGLAQKFLYHLYVIYYTLCDFAIPIICVGWGLAILCYFIFGKLKVPKYQKLAICWFGIFVTAVMVVMLFLPSFIKGLGA